MLWEIASGKEQERPRNDTQRSETERGIVHGNRELKFATGQELSTLLPSVLDKAFKGEP